MKGESTDFSGFTKQTETLLRGIGANELINEFKTRDISTNVLHKLTKEDFMLLGNIFILINILLLLLLAYFVCSIYRYIYRCFND